MEASRVIAPSQLFHKVAVFLRSGHYLARVEVAGAPKLRSTNSERKRWQRVGTMKALLVLILVSLAAATVMAYGRVEVAAGFVSMVPHVPRVAEPVVLLLSGSALIGVAGALRRSSFF
jgi:hypothetical protein